MKPENAITVWRFDDAPQHYQEMSQNGGDEDWIAFIPDAIADEWIGWLEPGNAFGCCCVEEHEVDGGVIRIGCHA